MTQLSPIANHIIFQFEDEKTKHMGINQFKESTDWGFEFALTHDGMEYGRWVKVIAVGPEASEIPVGSRVCVDKLKWTTEFVVDGETFWRTDTNHILLIEE